jgi:hypothetical protein
MKRITHAMIIALATGLASSIASGAPFFADARSNFYLHVGPGINATVTTADMHMSCSDDADCRFQVPANATYDVVAKGAAGHRFQWTGCSAQAQANRCRVIVRDDSVLITVR